MKQGQTEIRTDLSHAQISPHAVYTRVSCVLWVDTVLFVSKRLGVLLIISSDRKWNLWNIFLWILRFLSFFFFFLALISCTHLWSIKEQILCTKGVKIISDTHVLREPKIRSKQSRDLGYVHTVIFLWLGWKWVNTYAAPTCGAVRASSAWA